MFRDIIGIMCSERVFNDVIRSVFSEKIFRGVYDYSLVRIFLRNNRLIFNEEVFKDIIILNCTP